MSHQIESEQSGPAMPALRTPFVLGLAFLAAYFIWAYHEPSEAFFKIVDLLDSHVPVSKMMVDQRAFFGPYDQVVPNMLNGLPRNCLLSDLRFGSIVYCIFQPAHAVIFKEAAARLVAFIGMLLLLHSYVLRPPTPLLIAGVALCFAMVTFYLGCDFDVAGQPLIVWAFLNILRGKAKLVSCAIILSFPFGSNLVISGFAILMMLGAILTLELVCRRRFPVFPLTMLLLMLLVYLIVENRLIYQLWSHDAFISHRAEIQRKSFGWAGAMKAAVLHFLSGQWHAPGMQQFVLGPTAVIGVVLSMRQRWASSLPVLLLCSCGVISLLVGLYRFAPFQEMVARTRLDILSQWNYSRLYFLDPLLWHLLFALGLQAIVRLRRAWPFLAGLLVASQLAFSWTRTNVCTEKREHGLTYNAFFSPGLFEDIKSYVGKPAETYRVVSLGMHPSIALYNGLRTSDGYWYNYPLKHKQRFRRIIAAELSKNEEIRGYFDNWGSRCYTYSSEIGANVYCTKDSLLRRVLDLDLDGNAMVDLDIQYVISATEIVNSGRSGLNLLRVFERSDSPWQLFLYEVHAE